MVDRDRRLIDAIDYGLAVLGRNGLASTWATLTAQQKRALLKWARKHERTGKIPPGVILVSEVEKCA
jgi:hypothetical protein